MKEVLAIGAGSFIGGASRYLLSARIQGLTRSIVPYGTLLVNVLGCLLIGVVFSLAARGVMSPEWRLYLATGVIGGFTTFSAFSIETIHLFQAGRFMHAALYAGASLVLGLLAAFAGLWIGRRLPG